MSKGKKSGHAVGISDETTQAKTGTTLDDRFKSLDEAGATTMKYNYIVAHSAVSYRIGPLRQKIITGSYLQDPGQKEEYQKPLNRCSEPA